MEAVTCLHLFLLGLLINSFSLQAVEGKTCSRGWIHYGNKCYGVFTEKRSWPDAEVACQSYGRKGHLASFLSKQENAVLAKYIIANYPDVHMVWIGMHAPKDVGKWKWIDLSPPNFKPWNVGEPTNTLGQLCVYMSITSGFMKWSDGDCKTRMSFVCQTVL
ncbi:C-type lectin mannose-binding isoform-like [Elgaria multicarinata webbii]|uniref:C-type lectin mannose-binding isoform-like n=1 Tax=Elgaria multicarinata webbii TaxID=159646 RepID=UPI002FCD2922